MGSEKKKRRRDSEKGTESTRKKSKGNKGNDAVMSDAPAPEITEIAVYVSPIAKPMAGKKLTKKLFKVISKAGKAKSVRRGIKEVVLALRKEEKGVCVIAGDVYPVDVIAHLPLLCEEAEVPYCFVSRKNDLGAAGLTKRPTSVVLVSTKQPDAELKSEINDCASQVSDLLAQTV